MAQVPVFNWRFRDAALETLNQREMMLNLKPDFTVLVIEDKDPPQEQYRRCLRNVGIKDTQIAIFRTRAEAVGFSGSLACLIADIQVYSGSPADPAPAEKVHGVGALRAIVGSGRIKPEQAIVVSEFLEDQEVRSVVRELGIPIGNRFKGPVADEDLQEAVQRVLRQSGCCL